MEPARCAAVFRRRVGIGHLTPDWDLWLAVHECGAWAWIEPSAP